MMGIDERSRPIPEIQAWQGMKDHARTPFLFVWSDNNIDAADL